jgi:putative transcriptional regulator
LIRWKLSEIMARHRIKGKELANYIGISTNAMSALKNALVMPEIGGERWEQICAGINELSKIGEVITPFDLIEYVPESNIPVQNQESKTAKAQGATNRSKDSTSGENRSAMMLERKSKRKVA